MTLKDWQSAQLVGLSMACVVSACMVIRQLIIEGKAGVYRSACWHHAAPPSISRLHAQVVAPVRETAAQALGAAARGLPLPQLQRLAQVLRQLVSQPQWDVRQGGLLGLKFLLAATQSSQAPRLLRDALPAALQALQVCPPGGWALLGLAGCWSGCCMAGVSCWAAAVFCCLLAIWHGAGHPTMHRVYLNHGCRSVP